MVGKSNVKGRELCSYCCYIQETLGGSKVCSLHAFLLGQCM